MSLIIQSRLGVIAKVTPLPNACQYGKEVASRTESNPVRYRESPNLLLSFNGRFFTIPGCVNPQLADGQCSCRQHSLSKYIIAHHHVVLRGFVSGRNPQNHKP